MTCFAAIALVAGLVGDRPHTAEKPKIEQGIGYSMRIAARIVILAGAVWLATASSQAQTVPEADYVLLSDDYGGRGYIGTQFTGPGVPDEPLDALTAKELSGDQISALFVQLCLAKPFDRSSYDAALKGPVSEFRSTTIALSDYAAAKPLIGVNKMPGTQIVQERSDYGAASLWLGDGIEALPNRLFLRYSGGLVITGPVKAKDLYAPQCNLTVRVTGLTSAAALLDGVQNGAVGFKALKRAAKPKYGYGVWTRAREGGRTARITVDASSLHKAVQIVHLTVQLLPVGRVK